MSKRISRQEKLRGFRIEAITKSIEELEALIQKDLQIKDAGIYSGTKPKYINFWKVRFYREELQRRNKLVEKYSAKSSDIDNTTVWLEEFISVHAKKYLPIRYGENVFEVTSTDPEELKAELVDIAIDHSNVAISAYSFDVVAKSPNILKLLISRNISMIAYFQTEASILFNSLLQTFSTIEEQRKEAKLSNVRKAALTRKKNADQLALELRETIVDIENEGITTLQGIADELTNRQIPTPNNKSEWSHVAVKRIKERLDKLDQDSTKPE